MQIVTSRHPIVASHLRQSFVYVLSMSTNMGQTVQASNALSRRFDDSCVGGPMYVYSVERRRVVKPASGGIEATTRRLRERERG